MLTFTQQKQNEKQTVKKNIRLSPSKGAMEDPTGERDQRSDDGASKDDRSFPRAAQFTRAQQGKKQSKQQAKARKNRKNERRISRNRQKPHDKNQFEEPFMCQTGGKGQDARQVFCFL